MKKRHFINFLKVKKTEIKELLSEYNVLLEELSISEHSSSDQKSKDEIEVIKKELEERYKQLRFRIKYKFDNVFEPLESQKHFSYLASESFCNGINSIPSIDGPDIKKTLESMLFGINEVIKDVKSDDIKIQDSKLDWIKNFCTAIFIPLFFWCLYFAFLHNILTVSKLFLIITSLFVFIYICLFLFNIFEKVMKLIKGSIIILELILIFYEFFNK